METKTYRVAGDTKKSRESLKSRGYRWLPMQLSWEITVPAETVDGLDGYDLAEKIGGHKKGCRVLEVIDAAKGQVRVIWTSNSYVAPKSDLPRGMTVDHGRLIDTDGEEAL